jgi:hypothetical protein
MHPSITVHLRHQARSMTKYLHRTALAALVSLPFMAHDDDTQELHGTFGGQFRLLENSVDIHTTPSGSSQEFVYCFCRLEQ